MPMTLKYGGKLEWKPLCRWIDIIHKITPYPMHIIYNMCIATGNMHRVQRYISLSVLEESLWCFDKKLEYLEGIQCDPANHYHLLLFFHDNYCLKVKYTKLVVEENAMSSYCWTS